MPIDPAGRVQLTLDPAAPHKCIICTKSSNGTLNFVDFGVSEDFYGAVTICEDCIRECIGVVGFQQLDDLMEQHQQTLRELEVASEQLIRYKSALDGVAFIRPDLDPAHLASSVESEDEPEVTSEGDAEQPSADESASVGGLENISIFADD